MQPILGLVAQARAHLGSRLHQFASAFRFFRLREP